MNYVWVVTMKSESGDDYGPFCFLNKPSKQRIKDLIKTKTPEEPEYIDSSITRVQVIE